MTKKGMPSGRKGQCQARIKTCRECGYRFPKGDKSWYCDKCGAERRCDKDSMSGRPTCHLHGSKGGRPPSLKYKVSEQLAPAFAIAFESDQLLKLNQEIAIINARMNTLMERLEKLDTSHVHKDVLSAVNQIENAVADGDLARVNTALSRLRKAVDPIRIEHAIWYDIVDCIEQTRRLQDTERKWLSADRNMMEITRVYELIMVVQRIMFRYIPTAKDRSECAKEIQDFLPHPG